MNTYYSNVYATHDQKRNTMKKKRSEETQTLRAGCSKAEPEIFAPPQTPFPGGAGRPKFNQLEVVATFTHKPSLVRIDLNNSDVIAFAQMRRAVCQRQLSFLRTILIGRAWTPFLE